MEILPRENARSCCFEVFLIKAVRFPEQGIFVALQLSKLIEGTVSSCQVFYNFLSLTCENTCVFLAIIFIFSRRTVSFSTENSISSCNNWGQYFCVPRWKPFFSFFSAVFVRTLSLQVPGKSAETRFLQLKGTEEHVPRNRLFSSMAKVPLQNDCF